MNMVKLIKEAVRFIKDPEQDFNERIFLILTLVSEVAVFIAFIGDLLTHEDPIEIFIIMGVLVFVPIITFVCLIHNHLGIAIKVIVICLVTLVLPMLFFFGGGLRGGGVLWIIFAFLYVGLVLRGRWRNTMFVLITVLTLGCYLVGYYFPRFIHAHSTAMYYVDSFISLVLIGIMGFVMTWSQGRLFTNEKERAEKEAQRAEELTRSQNRFFSSMSHEIRTPINSILGLNELILRDQSASDDIVKDASGIQGSGKMLLALINDILDFSKIEAGSMDIVPVDYKMGDLLSEIVNMMWLRAHDKGLGFEVSVDPDVPVVLYGDEVRIKQIIINLLNNAVKYTREGHVELRVESKESDGETVELDISVSDTGMGIRKEDIPYLFDAFKRVDEGKNRHIEGTGLGLSIVKQLVELMDGTISVNSVYGEGTTFTFTIKQQISDNNRIGELNIHNQQIVKRSSYESSFLAPEARILIVDDNEMNLEVETRLLAETDMAIDKALSGKKALEECLRNHYDTIFMDHLMPGMDGIECLAAIREQEGGLNRTTPVIVLTANAGSENKELYNRAGFDGYLVKPVSGEAMEEMLIKHIPSEKMILRSVMTGDDEDINASDRYMEKEPVIITSSSMCDLPESVIRKLGIPIIPFNVRTDEGEFKDGIHIDANELVRYVSSGKEAVSSPPDENEYTEFFAETLKRAHHLIHISITTSMSKDYEIASEAARSFDNVSVINSECLSSSTGILVLIAYKLAQQGIAPADIVSELETVKHRIKCSFVIDTTEYMTKKKLVSSTVHKLGQVLNFHLSLRIRNDRAGLGGLWLGSTKRAYRKYIARALPPDTIPDSDVVFITYADVPTETLSWVEEEIRKTAYFEHVIFQQASAAISSNCGPGTFGILYFLKSNKSYNIASYIDEVDTKPVAAGNAEQAQETELSDAEIEETLLEESGLEEAFDDVYETADAEPVRDEEIAVAPEEKWYNELGCLNIEAAIENSGSEEAFKTVLGIFYDSIPDKYAELTGSYEAEDWENYTIKIHALKSSARLVGALELGEKAQLLEDAGKAKDVQYINEHHAEVMKDYTDLKEALAPVFEGNGDNNEKDDRPVADEALMQDIYEGIREAASAMDCDMLESILKEIEGYAIPEAEQERFNMILQRADAYDYSGILEIVGE